MYGVDVANSIHEPLLHGALYENINYVSVRGNAMQLYIALKRISFIRQIVFQG